jgi:hypothetical protein
MAVGVSSPRNIFKTLCQMSAVEFNLIKPFVPSWSSEVYYQKMSEKASYPPHSLDFSEKPVKKSG